MSRKCGFSTPSGLKLMQVAALGEGPWGPNSVRHGVTFPQDGQAPGLRQGPDGLTLHPPHGEGQMSSTMCRTSQSRWGSLARPGRQPRAAAPVLPSPGLPAPAVCPDAPAYRLWARPVGRHQISCITREFPHIPHLSPTGSCTDGQPAPCDFQEQLLQRQTMDAQWGLCPGIPTGGRSLEQPPCLHRGCTVPLLWAAGLPVQAYWRGLGRLPLTAAATGAVVPAARAHGGPSAPSQSPRPPSRLRR